MSAGHRGGPGLNRRLWLAVSVLAITAGFYAWQDSLIHFVWHVGYGAAAGLVADIAWHRVQGQTPREPILWALGGYLFMAIPDGIWLLGLLVTGTPWEHMPWMDVFLGHYSLDLWPYASLALLPLALLVWAAWTWLPDPRGPLEPKSDP